MITKTVEGGWLLGFTHGEDIVNGVLDFARTQKIEGGWVNMLGAIEDPELGYYDLSTRTYTRRMFPGDWEITAIVGNLAWLGETPVLHVHATIGAPDFSTRGGHLFAGRAGATCEVFVRDLKTRVARAKNEAVGLATWVLP
jgi:predicted DNA-binding protein with PD1-like motif